MENLKFFDKIKDLFSSKLVKDSNIPIIVEERFQEEHGFQLSRNDLSEYLKHFLTPEIINERLKNINSLGYMDMETGMELKSLIDDKEYDIYMKSVHSTQVESILNEGIRCLGTSSSLATINPSSIKEVHLENSITPIDDLTLLIEGIKKHNGVSQGFNQIDGTIILKIPKGVPKEDILYYNEETNTYNIKPEYNVGFLPVDTNHRVGKWVYPKDLNQNKNI